MEFILGFTIFMILLTVALGVYQIKKGLSGKNAKKILGINIVAVFGLLLFTTTLIYSGYMPVFAQGSETVGAQEVNGLGLIAAALSTGLAAIGAGIAVAISSSAALGAISENSSLLGKTLIFVGLSEGIAIYGLIVSILILGRL
ncbi:ATP synthase subunit C [Herbivorax sp. ANBcel31]|uniref:ATP synthase subunit C n=1 Tax=Herbivorax sp. ANBcel31 TaxID=3069754 RepID=UPI0027B39187|nr:ATP synthase subunit C [Herbivorax sp. ANBcel31]MDQ2087260.1 ATP synthase subunit C [Herbivorax sp. ANBcel31]